MNKVMSSSDHQDDILTGLYLDCELMDEASTPPTTPAPPPSPVSSPVSFSTGVNEESISLENQSKFMPELVELCHLCLEVDMAMKRLEIEVDQSDISARRDHDMGDEEDDETRPIEEPARTDLFYVLDDILHNFSHPSPSLHRVSPCVSGDSSPVTVIRWSGGSSGSSEIFTSARTSPDLVNSADEQFPSSEWSNDTSASADLREQSIERVSHAGLLDPPFSGSRSAFVRAELRKLNSELESTEVDHSAQYQDRPPLERRSLCLQAEKGSRQATPEETLARLEDRWRSIRYHVNVLGIRVGLLLEQLDDDHIERRSGRVTRLAMVYGNGNGVAASADTCNSTRSRQPDTLLYAVNNDFQSVGVSQGHSEFELPANALSCMTLNDVEQGCSQNGDVVSSSLEKKEQLLQPVIRARESNKRQRLLMLSSQIYDHSRRAAVRFKVPMLSWMEWVFEGLIAIFRWMMILIVVLVLIVKRTLDILCQEGSRKRAVNMGCYCMRHRR